MVTIQDEVIQKIKEHSFIFALKDVREVYSTKSPVYPMITVEELPGATLLQLHGEEILSTIGVRFEIYTRDTATDDGKVHTRGQVATSIAEELDELIRTTYGLTRTGDVTRLPYSSDGSILRSILTYTGKIDNRTMIIYQ